MANNSFAQQLKKWTLTITVLLISQSFFGQFAIVFDKDGYVNLRAEANTKSKIIGTIKSGEIVYIFNVGNDSETWLIIDYHDSRDMLLTGYVHKSRLKEISSFEKIPVKTLTENSVEFYSESRKIGAKIKSGVFDYDSNKRFFSKTKYGEYEIEDRFKGKQIWGTDGSIPSENYLSVTVSWKGRSIEVPEKEYENLFQVNHDFSNCYYDAKTDKLYLESLNSDGAGSYWVLFVFEKGKYKETIVYGTS